MRAVLACPGTRAHRGVHNGRAGVVCTGEPPLVERADALEVVALLGLDLGRAALALV